MRQFVRFLLGKVYGGQSLAFPEELIQAAQEQCIKDVQYHFQVPAEEVLKRITRNQNEMAIFLYRLGRQVFEHSPERDELLDAVHWLMRECCGCEIYFSCQIGEGFYIVHGLGTAICSRTTIGKGFQIYLGSTIGHLRDFEDGCVIGDNVIMMARSSIVGPVRIGDNVVIGSGCEIMSDVPPGITCLVPPGQRQFRVPRRIGLNRSTE